MQRSFLRLALLVGTAALLCVAKKAKNHDYCIIGAGPGGLQAAIYMHQLGMDYAVFEKSHQAGDFFSLYPRHRTLNSINKRFTGFNDSEFQLRHDWNSLLFHFEAVTQGVEEPFRLPGLSFKKYSTAYYPNASHLVTYLNDIVRQYRLRVKYNHTVKAVYRESEAESSRFLLEFESDSQGDARCKVVLLATGRGIPIKLSPENENFVEGYEKVDTNGASFENQTVVILGVGNSGLETADALQHDTASVFIVSRDPLHLAYQTHYVGHARSRNLGILDRYQFKSLDAFVHGTGPFEQFIFSRNHSTGKIMVTSGNPKVDDAEENPNRHGYDRVVRCMGFTWDDSIFNHSLDDGLCGAEDEHARCHVSKLVPVAPYAESRHRFMEVASNFESVNVPRLFAVGALMHFRDYKRGSGGFIHGFRYLARTLVLQLRERFEGVPYPSLPLGRYRDATDAAEALTQVISARLTNVSSLVHMHEQLADVLVWDYDPVREAGDKHELKFRYVKDIPLDQARSKNPDVMGCLRLRNTLTFMTMSLEYGKDFQGFGVLANLRQPELHSRQEEKQMWSEETDPDIRIREVNEPVVYTPGSGKPSDLPALIPNTEGAPKDIASAVASYKQAAEGVGYLKLHPVFRVYSRARQRPMKDSPQMIMEFAMQDDTHFEWAHPDLHLAPLRRFLKAAIPKLTKTV